MLLVLVNGTITYILKLDIRSAQLFCIFRVYHNYFIFDDSNFLCKSSCNSLHKKNLYSISNPVNAF